MNKKKLLGYALTACLFAAVPISAGAAATASGNNSVSGGNYSAPASLKNEVVLSNGTRQVSTIPDYFYTTKVNAAVISTPKAMVEDLAGLSAADKKRGVSVRWSVTDGNTGPEAVQALATAAVSQNKQLVVVLDDRLYRRDSGKDTEISATAAPILVTIQLPQQLVPFVSAGRNFSAAAVSGAGVQIAEDLDTNPETLTFALQYFGALALIY